MQSKHPISLANGEAVNDGARANCSQLLSVSGFLLGFFGGLGQRDVFGDRPAEPYARLARGTVLSVAGTVVSTTASVVGTVVETGVSVTGAVIKGVANTLTGSDAKEQPKQ